MDALRLVYVTAPDRATALAIGQAAVGERLAACANVLPGMTSVYRWRGAVEQAEETVLLLKTTQARVEALTARIRTLHPYDVPCVVVLAIDGGDPAFLDWLRTETA